MVSKFTKIKLNHRLCFMVLCVIALVGYTQPVINAHLSIHELGIAHSSGFGLTTVFDRPEAPVAQFAMFDELGIGQDDLAELIGDFNFIDMMIDIMYDAIRMARLFAVLYLAPLLLLLTILTLAVIDKFTLARQVLLVLAFALYAIAGPVILAVPEIAIDILTVNLEGLFGSGEILGSLVAMLGITDMIHAILNEALYVELGPGYWITVILLGCMLLAEATTFLKNRAHIPFFRPLVTSTQEQR